MLLAFTGAGYALVASDTRTTWRGPGDASPILEVDDTRDKIFATSCGWVASGPVVAWREAMLQAVGDDFPAGASAWAPRAMRELERSDPEQARNVRERQLTLGVTAGPEGCARFALDWQGQDAYPGTRPTTVIGLFPDVPAWGSRASAMLQALLNWHDEATRDAKLGEAIRLTAAFLATVAQACGPHGPMSPLVSLGIVWRDGRRCRVGPMAASDGDALARAAVAAKRVAHSEAA